MQPKCSLFFVSYVFAHHAAGRSIIRAGSPGYFNLISHGVVFVRLFALRRELACLIGTGGDIKVLFEDGREV